MAPEAAKLVIACECGQKMKVPASAIGKSVNCVQCGNKVLITAEKPPSSDPIPENFGKDPSNPTGSAMSAVDDATHLLVNKGLVDQSQLDEAEIVQRDLPGTTWSILIDMGHLDSSKFHTLMAQEEGVATIELENYSVPDDVISILPENLIRQHLVVPVDKLGKLLTLAQVCPHNKSIVKEAESITGLRIKTMLCTYEALLDTIKSKLPFADVEAKDSITQGLAKEFQSDLGRKIITRKVFRQDNLLPSNAELYQFQSTIENTDDVVTLAKVSAENPVLLARVLQMANSTAYGFPGKVTSFAQAAALLGSEGLQQAMQSDEFIDYKKQHKTFDLSNHLKRARFCAIAAQALATEIGSEETDAAYSAGLFFEIGRLVLLEILPNGYAMATRDEFGPDLYEIENRFYQFPYTEAGYYILRKFNVPSSITEPVRMHTQPREASAMSNVLFLAVVMTKAYINNEPLHIRTDEEDALHKIAMKSDQFESVYQAACSTFQQKMQPA